MEGKMQLETLGRHILVEFYNCNEETMKSPELIEKFITIARDMNQFNDKSDVAFVKMAYEAFLNDAERAEFLEAVTQHSI